MRAQRVLVHKVTCCGQGSEMGLGSWRSQRVLARHLLRRPGGRGGEETEQSRFLGE